MPRTTKATRGPINTEALLVLMNEDDEPWPTINQALRANMYKQQTGEERRVLAAIMRQASLADADVLTFEFVPAHVLLGDFNDDGQSELLVASSEGQLALYKAGTITHLKLEPDPGCLVLIVLGRFLRGNGSVVAVVTVEGRVVFVSFGPTDGLKTIGPVFDIPMNSTAAAAMLADPSITDAVRVKHNVVLNETY